MNLKPDAAVEDWWSALSDEQAFAVMECVDALQGRGWSPADVCDGPLLFYRDERGVVCARHSSGA
jgi:hypothetical protein